MKYILRGDPKEVAKVIQENRIRVERGVISITPVQPETANEDNEFISELQGRITAMEAEKETLVKEKEQLANRKDPKKR